MLDPLLQAYTPLICWTGLGILSVKFLPTRFPYWLGRGLYWIGVPIEIFSLARQTTFDERAQLAPTITVASLLLGLGLGWVSLQIWRRLQPDRPAPTPGLSGSLLLCSMLGNTGFVGLAIVPYFVSQTDLSWAVLYSVTQNVFGTYGLGVLVSSYYGRQGTAKNNWWIQLKDLCSVPSLWGFALGSLTRTIPFPEFVESSLHASIWVVIPGAFILMGIRLSQIQTCSVTSYPQNDRDANHRRSYDYNDGHEWRSSVGIGADVGDALRFCRIDSSGGVSSRWKSRR
jgi:malate permease and related proteins